MPSNLFIMSRVTCSLALLSLPRDWKQTTVLPEVWLLLLFVPRQSCSYLCLHLPASSLGYLPYSSAGCVGTSGYIPYHTGAKGPLTCKAPSKTLYLIIVYMEFYTNGEDGNMYLSIILSLIHLFLLPSTL